MEGGLGTTMFSGHKHTNRSLPVNNKLCNQRWVDRCQQLHRMRLNQIKPAIGAPLPCQRRARAGEPNAGAAPLMPDCAAQTTNPRRAISTCSRT